MKSLCKHLVSWSLAVMMLCTSAGAWNMGTTDATSQSGRITGNDTSIAIVDENHNLYTMGTTYWTNLQTPAAASNPQLLMQQVQAVAMSDVDFLILTQSGELWGMGRQGSLTAQMVGSEGVVCQPTKLMDNVVDMKISASDSENRIVGILTKDGTLQCWSTLGAESGYNQHTISRDVAAFSVSGNCVAYIQEDSTAWAWGENLTQIFGEAVDNSTTPARIFADRQLKGISVTDDGCLIVTTDGEVYATGTNISGRFGVVDNKGIVVDENGNRQIHTTPTFITGGNVKEAVLTGHTCFILKESGNVFAAGKNDNGELGVGQAKAEISSLTFVTDGVKALSARDENIMLVKQDGTLYSAGISLNSISAKLYSLMVVDYPKSTPAPIAPFTDIEGHWARESIETMYVHGVMQGVSDTSFAPDAPASRATIVSALYALSGKPQAPACTFTDVPEDADYANAVAWAEENGIVSGVGDGLFQPDANVTREQLAVMMYNYVQWRGLGSTYTSLDTFDDAKSVSPWAESAVRWMVSAELLHGTTGTLLEPQGTATRGQLATILTFFVQQYQLPLA